MPWNAVAVSGSVDIGSGTVNIGSGTVDLAPGTTVQLASGSTVNIAAGATVNIGGGQLTNGTGTPVQPVADQLTSGDLGTGADGAVTVIAATTLARDMQYSSLTVNAGVTLCTGGYVIRCQNTLTNNGLIHNNGTDGSSTAAGVGGLQGSLYGGANGAFYNGSSAGNTSGINAPAADVQGGSSGAVASYFGSTKPTTGTTTPSGAIGLSLPGLRSLTFAGGASGYATTNGGGWAASGGAGGVVIAYCGSTAGTGTWQANAGLSKTFTTGSYLADGSGGGICFIACRSRGDTWTLSATGAAPAGGSGTNTANAGFPGRSGILVCNGS